jgi:hypothetical protein
MKRTTTFTLTPDQYRRLQEIAKQNGCMWGDRGNPSELLTKIALGEILIGDDAVRQAIAGLPEEIVNNLRGNHE